MRNIERVTSVKSELLDIFMSMEVSEHAERRRASAQRSLRARRGIELHREFQQLTQEISDLPENELELH
ncbi:PA3496 family putative envelope integrity protein [Vreelandella aquamarina]